MMFDHIGIFVTDTAKSFAFYEAALAPLGLVVRERQRQWGSIVMAGPPWQPFLWIGQQVGFITAQRLRETIDDRFMWHFGRGQKQPWRSFIVLV